jgi:ATP-dependent DNA helicase RecG
VQVELFPNRLVVRNPGGLHGPVTVDQLFEEGVSSSRNARLLRLLEDVPISGEDRTVVENRGSGIRVMAQALRSAGMNLPQFDNQISRFSVTFPNHTLLSEETVRWVESLEQDGLSDSQIVALATMRSGEVLDNPKYRSLTGSDSRVATGELQDLVARELVNQAGERRWARYSMPMGVAQERRRLAPANRRTEILAAMGADTLSAKEISERTRIPVKTVRHWLKRLRDEDKVRFAPGGGAPQSNLTKYEATVPLLDENAMTLFDAE